MKKFNIFFLLILIAAFASAQAQKSAVQKTDVKSESIQKQTSATENTGVVPAEKKVEPEVTDALYNINDEKFIEQKKREQKKDTEKKTDTPK